MQHAAQRNKKLRIVYRFYHPNNIIIKSVRCLKCLSADVLAVFLLDDAVHCGECTTHQVPQLGIRIWTFFLAILIKLIQSPHQRTPISSALSTF